MTKEELRREAQESYIKLLRQNNCRRDYNCETYNDGYIAGAEPREKRIAELEDKLAEETAQRIYNFNKSIEWKEKHRELEKENAELEKQLEETKLQNAISEEGLKKLIAELERKNESLENIKNIYIGDLLKAKRIINKMSTCFSSYSSNIFEEELLKEAEQFISEVEK